MGLEEGNWAKYDGRYTSEGQIGVDVVDWSGVEGIAMGGSERRMKWGTWVGMGWATKVSRKTWSAVGFMGERD